MLKKMMLIINPFSGKGKAKAALFDIVSLFAQEGYSVTVFVTGTEYGNSTYFAEHYSSQFDLVVCVGGDGTLSDVITGLMRTASPPPIGYIPMGTANDMATTLSLPRDPKEAVFSVINGEPVPLDVGAYNDEFFTYIAAFGAFTEVSYSTPQNEKKALGHLAYVVHGISSLHTIKPYHAIVEHDGGVIEDDFIFGGVTNSTSVAGLVKLDPTVVELGDGLFEVILVKHPLTIADLNSIIMNILKNDYSSDNVKLIHTKKVKFTFDEPVEWTRDGENGGSHKVLEIENRTKAISIMLTKK